MQGESEGVSGGAAKPAPSPQSLTKQLRNFVPPTPIKTTKRYIKIKQLLKNTLHLIINKITEPLPSPPLLVGPTTSRIYLLLLQACYTVGRSSYYDCHHCQDRPTRLRVLCRLLLVLSSSSTTAMTTTTSTIQTDQESGQS